MGGPTINTSVSLQVLWQTYTDQVLKTVIPRNTDLGRHGLGKATQSQLSTFGTFGLWGY